MADETPPPEHEPSGEYDNLRFDDPEFQKRLALQKANFGYGLMSMDDVEFTDSVTDESQDKRAINEYRLMLTDGADSLLTRDSGAETKRQKAIRHIFREAKHPLGSLWDWAKRGKSKRARYRRWRSLQYWAQGQREGSEGSDEWKKWNHARQTYRSQKRRVYRRIHDQDDSDGPSGTMTTLDGKPVPSWIAAGILKRRSNGWSGVLVSGYRTPAYSQQLCYNICGRPSCPGLCAGTSSNHCAPPSFSGVPYEGACDVSYYWEFPEYDHLVNNLPRDLVHFSNSGY